MFEFINFSALKLQTLVLIIMRTSGLFILAPIIGNSRIPNMIRIGLLLLLSLILTSVLEQPVQLDNATFSTLTVMAAKEMLIGLIIGLFFLFVFHAVLIAGGLVGYQIGFAMVVMFDPTSGDQVSIIGQFWTMIATLIFLSINGHHLVIQAFADSYQVMPPGAVLLDGGLGELIMKYTAYVFVVALKLASPVLITLFLTDVALGTVAKTMPTMNVFFVGFPIKIGVGLLVMAMSLPLFSYVLQRAVEYLDYELHSLYLSLGSA